ncbi:LysR family transcriptional regulator [Acetobacteraceae bacterium KSS8]|uniref:LysR family transcriptional regulator n=1 Tax=Endosaccharibacter trunci TaxID=2812733 RepID=A0ABT1W3L7_9PROT|nr:LysR family transcriptional regulator [Acetobacteraceae bacterium KSS8]
MTLEQLRIFLAVAERQHVTEAARALNLTQSAVSNAVAALEERHAVRLFDRVGRGIVLNENGRAFLPEARAVMDRAALAEAVLHDLGGLRRGRLRLCASQTIAGYWLPERLARFHAAYPAVELDVSVGNTHEVAQAVLEGGCEIGFVEGAVDHAGLELLEIGRDRLLILCRPSHPWARLASLTAADLSDAAWIMREAGSGTRSSLEAAMAEAGCDPAGLPVSLVLPSNEAVLSAVQAGNGVAALSQYVAGAALAAGLVTALPFDLPARPFHALRHRDRFRTRAVEAFVQLLPDGAAPAEPLISRDGTARR